MNEISFDDAVRQTAEAVLAARTPALQSAGLHTTVELKRWSQQGGKNSELRIVFWQEDKLVDVVEDFVVQDGQPVASLSDFEGWLEQSVDTVLTEASPP